MKKDKTTLYKCYQLLQNVLTDTFHTETILFEAPYKDVSRIDQGFRAFVWKDYTDEMGKITFSEKTTPYRMITVKSNLGFYNVLIFFDIGEKPDFISIGPFRDEELTADYYVHILKEAHLKPMDFQGMKYRYERMPFADPQVITKIAKHIISAFWDDFKEVEGEFVEYSEQNRDVAVNTDIMKKYSIEFTEKYKEKLFAFLSNIKQGKLPEAREMLRQFLQESQLIGGRNIHEDKLILHMLNDYCHMALMDTSVHPAHIMSQAFSIKAKIDNLSSLTKLNQMAYDICRKYCLIVHNFANSEYSKMTRDVINYIDLHLEEELTLKNLADIFGRNASVLSNLFSKEVGVSLTKYIQKTRVQEAVRLFNTTALSVSEVAVVVGYQDFSYFSKIFSREIGCSPREYKAKKTM